MKILSKVKERHHKKWHTKEFQLSLCYPSTKPAEINFACATLPGQVPFTQHIHWPRLVKSLEACLLTLVPVSQASLCSCSLCTSSAMTAPDSHPPAPSPHYQKAQFKLIMQPSLVTNLDSFLPSHFSHFPGLARGAQLAQHPCRPSKKSHLHVSLVTAELNAHSFPPIKIRHQVSERLTYQYLIDKINIYIQEILKDTNCKF